MAGRFEVIAMRINGQEFTRVGEVTMVCGQGRSAFTLAMTVLERDQQRVFLHRDNYEMVRLYSPTDPPAQRLVEPRRGYPVSQLDGYAEFSGSRPQVQWGRLPHPCSKPELFEGSDQALVLEEAGQLRSFYAITLTPVGPEEFVSARIRAEELPQKRIAPVPPPPAPSALWRLLALLVAGLLAAALLGSGGALAALWAVLGGCALSRSRQATAQLLTTTFCLGFISYPVDYYLWPTNDAAQAAKWAGLLLAVLVVGSRPNRFERVLTVATQKAGIVSVAAAGLITLLQAIKSQSSPLQIFYHQCLPMPYWLATWACFLLIYARDYWNVPLDREGFVTLLTGLREGFQGTPAELRARGKQLAGACDDLEDALGISRDPRVRRLAGFAPDLKVLQRTCQLLRSLPEQPEVRHLQQDLQVLHEDLGRLIDALESTTDGAWLSLRISPYLRCLEWPAP